MSDKPIAYDAYQKLADSYAALIDTKPHNAYCERPAMVSLLPELVAEKSLMSDAARASMRNCCWLAEPL